MNVPILAFGSFCPFRHVVQETLYLALPYPVLQCHIPPPLHLPSLLKRLPTTLSRGPAADSKLPRVGILDVCRFQMTNKELWSICLLYIFGRSKLARFISTILGTFEFKS